ncbi:glycosyltransferase 87 family protein [Kitasatospora sp. RG8]|uniref:glycosyltransferase 87 family protein n=1 Tax=Kitasatospora sp. RG8 TaxID=2820815 RepID=UPI0027DC54EF|nr:glycosyltransferase 87 family protein [Kitasatospora sp. RG8]
MLIHRAGRRPTIRQLTRPAYLFGRRAGWFAGWLAAAGWAGAFPFTSGLAPHRSWGAVAATGYLAAAVAVLVVPWRRARPVSVAVATAGAVVVPLLGLALTGQGQSEVTVIERSAALLLEHGSPYLAEPLTVTDYTPYLPAMALLGLPRALLGADGWPARLFGDARLWCAAVLIGCLWATGRPYRRGLALLAASPLVALPLCVSGVDLPMTGLCCLALALGARGRPGAAGLALALACSLKWTAWPAVAVTAALLAATAGRRAALRGTAVAVAGTAALVLPVALRSPGPLVRQVFAFPTGRGGLPTPAGSPLPGRLLADLGPAGWYAAVGLLLLAGLAVAGSLAVHPPRDAAGAADRLALGLCLAFLLAPAGRFGYLALPLVLVVWARVPAVPRPSPRTAPLPRTAPALGAPPASPHSTRPLHSTHLPHSTDRRTEVAPTPWPAHSSSPMTSRPGRAA